MEPEIISISEGSKINMAKISSVKHRFLLEMYKYRGAFKTEYIEKIFEDIDSLDEWLDVNFYELGE